MQNLSFVNISDKYIPLKNEDPDGILNKIYSKFNFLYLPLTILNRVEKDNKNMIMQKLENALRFLFGHLKGYNFITYKFTNITENLEATNSKNSSSQSTYFDKNIDKLSRFQPVNIIICSEDKCFIIEKIDYSLFNIIINTKKASQKHVIDTTKYCPDSNENNDIEANEEIDNFIDRFKSNIKNNLFIKYTIRPIIGYLIRRHFCPTSFFNDPSFFIFGQENYSKEQETKNQLNKSLFSKNSLLLTYNLVQFSNQIKEIQEDQTKISEFQLKDFIILRTLHANSYASFHMVIHIESLYIFMLKKYFIQKVHENYFCENFAHRCFPKFYGFVNENNKRIGFVYQYMCNKSLQFLVQNQPNLFNNSIYSLMTINRIFQGMNYLHQNMLIHRDLKPSNILIDHDFIPYVSDFDEVRHFDNNESSLEEMTGNIGTLAFSSPEQNQGKKLTNVTDIFSFGLIIYFIYEKKNHPSHIISEKSKISLISKAPENIQNIYKSCVKFNPSERMKNQEIKSKLLNEISSFSNIEQFLLGEESTLTNNLPQFLLENLFIAINNIKMTNKFYENILIFNGLFLLKSKKKYSLFYEKLGDLLFDQNEMEAIEYYELSFLQDAADLQNRNIFIDKKFYQMYSKIENPSKNPSVQDLSDKLLNISSGYYIGEGLKQDYLKAKKYLEISAKLNNSQALNNLGSMYYHGQGVEQNYLKAKEYYELAAKQNNSYALSNLGELYYSGYDGVKQNFEKAKECFELSAKQNNSEGLYNMGCYYYQGYAITPNYEKAKGFFELSAKQNHSKALFFLGKIYLKGLGVKQDYSIAKKYFELSAKQNNSDALYYLGNMYRIGSGLEKNYKKAKEYFELSAKQNNSEALNCLGDMYYNGVYVKKNYSKAKEYYELSAKQGNPEALSSLGGFYEYGYVVEQSYSKAREYYELSAKQKYPIAYYNLGLFYFNGYGVKIDYLKSKYYFELAAKQNVPAAFHVLGLIYINGYEVEKDYLKAKEYFELAVENKYYYALFHLGFIYENGLGVEIDYFKAKEYYELASKHNISDAFSSLGIMHFVGIGTQKNELMGIDYLKLGAKQNNPDSLFFLGYIYSTDKYWDISKAIKYYLSCYDIHFQKVTVHNDVKIYSGYNHLCYRSANDVGLLYLTVFQDIEKATIYIKESAFGEYTFGQSNFGLLNQFYLNQIENAEYMYQRSAQKNFSLAEYNLGYLNEKQNKNKEAIEYYLKASEHEKTEIKFCDSQLEISMIFILCLTNLKLTKYYLSRYEVLKAKKYFNKAFSRIPTSFVYDKTCSYLIIPILFCPLFNILNQPYEGITNYIENFLLNLCQLLEKKTTFTIKEFIEENLPKPNSEIEKEEEEEFPDEKISKTELILNSKMKDGMYDLENFVKQNKNFNLKDYKREKNEKAKIDKIESSQSIKKEKFHNDDDIYTKVFDESMLLMRRIFFTSDEFFNFMASDLKRLLSIENEIQNAIHSMEEILYIPPYPILFGRLSFKKERKKNKIFSKDNQLMKKVNELFLEGFGIDLDTA